MLLIREKTRPERVRAPLTRNDDGARSIDDAKCEKVMKRQLRRVDLPLKQRARQRRSLGAVSCQRTNSVADAPQRCAQPVHEHALHVDKRQIVVGLQDHRDNA